MSSDSAADLAKSLGAFATGIRSLLNGQNLPQPGSPADTEAAGEPYAHAWGDHPGRDIYASVLLQAWSCADHLLAASELIASRSVSVSPYTVIRAATEAAAAACYMTDDEITPLERMRRNMNYRLEGLSQQIVMMTSFTIPGAAESVAAKEAQLKTIADSGWDFGFQFRGRDGHKSAFFRDRPPSAMQLIDRCASRTPGLGITYQRYLSSVAHGQLHGLMQFAMNPVTLLVCRAGNL